MNYHIPVLLKEIIQYLNPQPGQIVVDGTLGGGGHSLALAKAIQPDGTLVGIDLDPASLEEAKKTFTAAGIKTATHFVRGNYKDIDTILEGLNIKNIDAIFADIGISSYDLENSARGFSFQKNEALDMRFDPLSKPEHKRKEPLTAKFILSQYEQKDLENIFKTYGEEKFARNIAALIVKTRQEKDISSTEDLFDLIKQAIPAKFRFKAADSARRVFQSLRIEVNGELDNLQTFLPKAFALLKPGGKLAVISFHSLEDRIVKQFFAKKAKGCICPPDFPQCVCGKNAEGKILHKKTIQASEAEITANPRSRPAKLRVIQKIF